MKRQDIEDRHFHTQNRINVRLYGTIGDYLKP